jgi:hypothetical protein
MTSKTRSQASPVLPRRLRYLSAVLTTVALLSLQCAHAPPASHELSCENFDWYETGRTDGSSGLPASTFRDRQSRCSCSRSTDGPNSCREQSSLNELLYMNGREAGLVLYCTPTMAFEMGKVAQPYEGVCPDHLDARFKSAYTIGQRVRSLEGDNIDLDSRMETILRLLPSSHPVNNTHLRTQLESLKTRRASNETEISKLETAINSTQN